jgi:hypothetical protein
MALGSSLPPAAPEPARRPGIPLRRVAGWRMSRAGKAPAVAGALLAGLLAAGCSHEPASPLRPSVESCIQFSINAIQHHVTVTSVPPECRGLTRAQVNYAVGRAVHAMAATVRGKASQRARAHRLSPAPRAFRRCWQGPCCRNRSGRRGRGTWPGQPGPTTSPAPARADRGGAWRVRPGNDPVRAAGRRWRRLTVRLGSARGQDRPRPGPAAAPALRTPARPRL